MAEDLQYYVRLRGKHEFKFLLACGIRKEEQEDETKRNQRKVKGWCQKKAIHSLCWPLVRLPFLVVRANVRRARGRSLKLKCTMRTLFERVDVSVAHVRYRYDVEHLPANRLG